MNYYKRHIGDYLRDAGHLSLLEHGVYSRLLDIYYTREGGIPDDQAERLVGARSPEEREAVRTVLPEFFTLVDGIWRQKRCDEEISVAQEKAERNREIGKRGGRPSNASRLSVPRETKPITNPEETQTVSNSKPGINPDDTQSEPSTNPSHKPLAISQEKEKDGAPSRPSPTGNRLETDWVLSDEWRSEAGRICEELRRRVDIDREAAKFRDYWMAQPGVKGRKTDWMATWRNWIRKACEYTQGPVSVNRFEHPPARVSEAPPERTCKRCGEPMHGVYQNDALCAKHFSDAIGLRPRKVGAA